MVKLTTLLLLIFALAACASPLAAPQAPAPAAAPLPAEVAALQRTLPPLQATSTVPIVTPTPEPPRPLLLWAAASEPELALLGQFAAEWSERSGRELQVLGYSADAIRAGLLVAPPQGQRPALIWGDEQDLAALYTDGQLQPIGDLDVELLAAPAEGGRVDGKRWGVPIAVRSVLLLLYNRRLVETPPATTDDLIALSRQLTRNGYYGLVYNWPDTRWLLPWLSGFDGTLLAEDGQTPTLDTPTMDSALALLQELRIAGPPPPSTYEDGVELFASGKAAMIIDGDWSVATYSSTPDTLDLGIAPLPLVPATGHRAASPIGASYLMVHVSLPAADLKAVRDFAAFLISPASQRRIAELKRLPVLPAALAEPAVQGDPLLAALAITASEGRPLPMTPAQRCVWHAIGQGLPPLLLGQQDRAATMVSMQTLARQCIDAR